MRQPATVAHPYVALERAFAFAGLVAAGGAAAAGCLARKGYGWQAVLMVTMISLLVCAIAGIWAQDMVARFQRGELARIYATAVQNGRDRRLERRAREPTRLEAIGMALASLMDSLRVTVLGRDNLARWAGDMRVLIAARQRNSEALAAQIGEDAHVLADAAAGSRHAESDIISRLDHLRHYAIGAAESTTMLADEVDGLASAVRAVTLQSGRAAELAVQMSDVAFTTHRKLAGLVDNAATMMRAANEVHGLLYRAEMLAMNASIEAGHAGEEGHGFAVAAAEVKNLAHGAGMALAGMIDTMRALQTEMVDVSGRVEGLGEVVQAQHQFGHALAQAASQQAEAIGRVMQRLEATNSGVRTMFAEVDGFRLPDGRLSVGAAAEQAMERLPGYAEAMAQILRGLPELNKSPEPGVTGRP